MASSSSPSVQAEVNSVTEKQLWEIAKLIPGLNVTYGTVRCIVYIVKKDEKETAESVLGAINGAVQTTALTAGVFASPVTIPIAAGVLTGVVAKTVTESVEVLVFFATNADQFQSKTSDQREQLLYNRLKNVTGIGALYSAIRVPVYLFKKDKQQSIESGVSTVENTGNTAVKIGLSMLPDVDEQLQKLIEKTSRYAINILARKIREQVAMKNLPLEEGKKTIETVENDCQRIIEVTTVSEDSSTTIGLNPVLENSTAGDNSIVRRGKWRRMFGCCSCSCSKSSDSKSEHVPRKKVSSDTNFGHENIGMSGNAEVSNEQIIILTD